MTFLILSIPSQYNTLIKNSLIQILKISMADKFTDLNLKEIEWKG